MIRSNVRKIMEEKGVTIRAMAGKTGLTDVTILRARKETIVHCRVSTLVVIAQYLECKVKDLFEEP